MVAYACKALPPFTTFANVAIAIAIDFDSIKLIKRVLASFHHFGVYSICSFHAFLFSFLICIAKMYL